MSRLTGGHPAAAWRGVGWRDPTPLPSPACRCGPPVSASGLRIRVVCDARPSPDSSRDVDPWHAQPAHAHMSEAPPEGLGAAEVTAGITGRRPFSSPARHDERCAVWDFTHRAPFLLRRRGHSRSHAYCIESLRSRHAQRVRTIGDLRRRGGRSSAASRQAPGLETAGLEPVLTPKS